jgi:hypothetical protein
VPKVRFHPGPREAWFALVADAGRGPSRLVGRTRDVLKRLEAGERPADIRFTDPPVNSMTLVEGWVLLWSDALVDDERIIAVHYLGPASFA